MRLTLLKEKIRRTSKHPEFWLGVVDHLYIIDRHIDTPAGAQSGYSVQLEPTLDELKRYKKNIDKSIDRMELGDTFSVTDKERILEEVNLNDIIEYELHDSKRSGNKIYAICPFHDEDTASLVGFDETNTFKCFGCGTKGNSIRFIMLLKNYSFSQAIKYIKQNHE